MSSHFWTKDPTKLPCPRCGSQIDAGASIRSLRLLIGNKLACDQCGANLEKKVTSYGSGLPALLTVAIAQAASLAEPWTWVIPLLGIGVSIWLAGKEIQSAHLVLKEPKR